MGKAPTKLRALGRGLSILLALFALSGFFAVLVWGFVEGRQQAAGDAQRDLPIKPPLRVSFDPGGQPVIRLDAEAQAKSGLKIEAARPAEYREQVRAYGTVLDLANLTALATNYVAAVSQVKAAEAKLAASKSAFERAQELHRTNAGSLAQSEAAEAAYRSDAAGLAAAQSQSRTIAATAIQEWGQTIGSALLQAAPMVERLIDRKDLLIQITLPPGRSIEPPPMASVQIGGAAASVETRFISAAPRTDPKIQGLSFFYLAPAGNGLLPGMSVLAFLSSGAAQEGLRIPPSAVVWDAGKAWVYLRTGPETFMRHEIPASVPAGADGTIIVPAPALAAKAPRIVTKGAQLLLSEEFRAQIQVGEDPNQ